MASILNKCATTQLSDGLISFIQYLFRTPDITPAGYRWNADEKATEIFISGPFTISREKVGQLPTVTVARSPFQAQNRVIDHLKKADPNTFENEVSLDLLDGGVSIICEAGAGDEASALAMFIFLEIQANRKQLLQGMPFVHRFLGMSISNETPVKEAAEIERWQAIVNISVTLYLGWMKYIKDPEPWRQAALFNTNDFWQSQFGRVEVGSAILTDDSADFGFLTANNPKFLQSEFEKRWYYVLVDGMKLTVEEIISNKKLRLSVVDADQNVVAFAAATTKDAPYRLVWNSVHIYMEFPKKGE